MYKLRYLQRFMKNIKILITKSTPFVKKHTSSQYLTTWDHHTFPIQLYTIHSKNEKITSLILKRLSPLKQRMGWRKRRLTYWSYVIFGWSPLDSPQLIEDCLDTSQK